MASFSDHFKRGVALSGKKLGAAIAPCHHGEADDERND
jgi:hypothetical protein